MPGIEKIIDQESMNISASAVALGKTRGARPLASNFKQKSHLFLLLACLITLPQTAYAFLDSHLYVEPTEVQYVGASVGFWSFPEQRIPKGGEIKLIAPDEVLISVKDLTCFDAIKSKACTVTAFKNAFTIILDYDVEPAQQVQFVIGNAVTNPVSEKPSSPFQLRTSVGEIEEGNENTQIKATRGRMRKYVLTPGSQIVGDPTSLTVEFSGEHLFPKGGKIFIDFPKWNPENPVTSAQKSYIQGSEACEPVKILSEQLFCDFQNDRLTVHASSIVNIESNVDMEFKVTGFKNPIQASLISGFQITTAILYQDTYYVIDQDETQLAVSDFAKLASPLISVIDETGEDPLAGMVQEMNDMQLDFYLPVPLNIGCKIKLSFPRQYSIDDVRMLETLNAFGQFTQYTFEKGNLRILNSERALVLNGVCQTYIENSKQATIRIRSLRQPNFEKTTDSFKVQITTLNDNYIAMQDEKFTFTPERGSLKTDTDAEMKIVQEPTKVSFELIPQHAIYLRDNPEIIITFPQETQIQTTQCVIEKVSLTGSTASIAEQCFRNEQAFTVKTFLPEDYIPALPGEPEKVIKFTLGHVINPISVQKVDGMEIVAYATNGAQKYAIDEWQGYIGWVLEQGSFIDAKIQPSTYDAYEDEVVYTLTFTAKHLIPQNGYIEIDFPKQVSVPDYSYSQSSCAGVETSAFGSNQITCKFLDDTLSDPFRLRDPNTPDHYTMQILNAFRRSSVPGGQQFKLTLPGMRNPIQTVPTFSFKFRTYDQRGQLIDELKSGKSIMMDQPSKLNIVLVQLENYTNAAVTDYTVTMVPTVPVWEQNVILITFPSQIELPDTPQRLDCFSIFTSLLADVRCSFATQFDLGRTVRVDLTFADGLEQIDPLDRFSITLRNIRNPTTTQTTDSLQVRITDSNYISINDKLEKIVVTTNNAYTIGKAFVKAVSPKPGFESPFDLDFYPEHPIQSGGGILVVYPPQTLLGQSGQLTAEVQVDGILVEQDKLEVEFDTSARSVKIKNIIQTAQEYVPDGVSQKISVRLNGLRTPYTSIKTDSFQMTTFNYVDNTFYYFIDQLQNGLSINSDCNYPCESCPSGQPSVCLSCYPETMDIDGGRPKLQKDTCVTECAADRFFDETDQRCKLCDPTCLSCSGSAKTCTSCGIGDNLFLHQAQCLTQCPDGFIEDPSSNNCKACSSECLTCEGLPTSCTSCAPDKFFYHESCIDECIPKQSVQVGDQCIECDSKCLECEGTPQTCTKCAPHMKLDPFRRTCVDLCEREVQVWNEQAQQCEYCDDNCTKCAGNSQTCTECKPGFVLNFDQTCKPTCGALNQTPIDGVCQICEEPCFQCSGSVSTCKTCIPDYSLFLGTKCVQYCPEKYANNDINVCVYEGLVCPPGFELNQSKDGCIPKKFDCDPGYTINETKTACIPEPGSAVPFPFFLLSLLLCMLVLGSYLKDKQETKVLTNLISLIGALEIIMYIMMVIYSYALEEYLILMFVVIGLIGLLASNIIFVAYYRQQISKDRKFVKWLHFFPKTKTWVPLLSLLVNFKCGKMFYSGFFGLESTQAKFYDHKRFFYLLRLTAYFSFIFCYGFIFIADVIILAQIDWGYQLYILAIETLTLQLLIIIMTVIEFRKGADGLLMDQDEQFSMFKPNSKGRQVKVMGGIEDDDDYEEGIPDVDEDTLIRSKIKTEQLEIGLRQQALARILSQVGEHPTEKGVDIQDCLTKFDPERIKLRRCFSLSNIDSDESWVADGPEDEKDETASANKKEVAKQDKYGNVYEEGGEPRARRYSFPMSPKRQKNLPNTLVFEQAIEDIKEANHDFLIDNVYTETKPVLDPFAKRKVKTVSRRTQTYLRELLKVDGEEAHESDLEVLMEDEAELDFDFAKGLIDKVIEHISSADESAPVQEKKKKPKKKSFKPKKEIPDFELADIMGDFEIDDMGNFIIMRGDGGELLDQRERLVNRRGYLIDRFGNVINMQGNIIFKAIELDVDDEIPAPFGFEKRKKNLLKLGDENQFKVESARDSRTDNQIGSNLNLDDEELLDKEVSMIKDKSQKRPESKTQTIHTPTPDEEHITVNNQPSHRGDNSNVEQEGGIEDDDGLEAEIDQLVKKKVPKKRRTLKGTTNKGSNFNNPPPKRIKPNDVKDLFPHLRIEHDEQRRLAKIASSISGLASQLADKQRVQQQVDDRKHSAGALHFQALDWNSMPEEQKIEQIRQEQLREIMAGSELAATEKLGEHHAHDQSFLLQDRPNSNTHSLNLGGLNMTRQMSAIAPRPFQRESSAGFKRHRSSNKPFGVSKMRDRTDDLKKVYGQAVDLTEFERQQLEMNQNQQNQQVYQNQQRANFNTTDPGAHNDRQRRGQSGRPAGRIAGLETIYMSKIPKLKPSMNMNVSASNQKSRIQSAASRGIDCNPFRPTLDRFADDPSELNVNTLMHGSSHHAPGGRDILEIADQLDQMQRDYLYNKQVSGTATQKLSVAPAVNMTDHKTSSQQRYHVQQQQHPNEDQQQQQIQLDDESMMQAAGFNKISGGQSHYVRGPHTGLSSGQGQNNNNNNNVDARTNSGGKRFAANSEANDSIDPARRDNWLPGEEYEEE